MKITTALILSIVLSLTTKGLAQQAGTLDPNFFQNGRYTINKPGSAMVTTFMDVYMAGEGGDLQYKIVAGGTVYENHEASGGFLTEIKKGLEPDGFIEGNDFGFSMVGGQYADKGKIVALEQKTEPMFKALVSQYLLPGVPDENFGEAGEVQLPNDNENTYTDLDQVVDPEGKKRIVVTGTKKKGNSLTLTHNILYADYDINEPIHEVEGPVMVGVPMAFAQGYSIASAGTVEGDIMISLYNLSTETFLTVLFPEMSIPGQSYEPRGLYGDGDFLYLTGYYYNSTTGSKGSFIQCYSADNLTQEPALTNTLSGYKPDPSSGMEDAYLAHLLKMNIAYQPGGMKSTTLSLYYISGLMRFPETGRMTTFVTCLNSDGSRRTDFGENGFFLVDLETGNSPGALVATEDGDLFLAVNAGENVYIYKINGVKPSSSTDFTQGSATTLDIFPNPTSDQFQVRVESQISGQGNISLRTLTGQSLIRKPLVLLSGADNQTTVDVSGIPSGIYLMTLQTCRELIHQKVMIR